MTINPHFSAAKLTNNSSSTDRNVKWWAGPDSNQRPSARQAHIELLSEKNLKQENGALIENFFDFLIVDLKRSEFESIKIDKRCPEEYLRLLIVEKMGAAEKEVLTVF